MTVDEIYERGYTFLKFSDYEMDFQLDRNENKTNTDADSMMLDYLKGIESVTLHPVENLKITANIATQPKRFDFLLQMLESIDGQFDEIRLYLNNFREVPKELEKYTCYIGRDLTDNGKFFWSGNKNEYYFTLDDDVIYPPDYVEKTLPLIGNRIVTYHGRNLFGLNQPYYDNHKIYLFYKKLNKEVKLDVGSTGFMAFNTNLFTPHLWKSPNKKMTDLLVALEAAMYNIDLVCLKKESNWIKPIELYHDGIRMEFIRFGFEDGGEDNKQSSIADMILIYKRDELKFDRSLISLTLEKSSVEILYQKILNNIGDSNNFSFYHLGCGNGNMIYHLGLISDFKDLVGVDTVDERIQSATSIIKNFEDRKKFHFLNIGYDGLEFEENSVVFVNDWAISSEHTENVWQKLNNNCHLISTKIINAQPQDKITVVTENNIQLTYYYYIKKCEPVTAVSKYQKTFVINLDDCQHSEKRWQLLKEKFNYFNNVERFSASKGRVEDYQLYVGDRWDWGSFTGRQSHIVRMTDGEVGCCMSHIRIWKKIVEDDIDVCLVVEDDANKILPGFDLILSNLINKLPKDWDVFIIGFMLFRDKGELVSDDFLKIKEFLLTHCYLINKKGAQKFLENLQVDSPIDTFMTRCSDKVNIYSHNYFRRKDADKMYPALISQSSKEPGVLSLITKFQGRV
jgi:GR25 family glycosyltransferase involved in LPS biosynthesis